MDGGIYTIEHVESGKRYVGSAINFTARLRRHRSMLVRGGHDNARLQNAWDKYGAPAFVFKPLIICAPKDLIFYEQRAIDAFGGYNICRTAGSTLGRRPSEETRRRLVAAQLGRVLSPEHKERIRQSLLGKALSPERRERIRQSHLGKKMTPESRRKMSLANLGRRVSLVISEAHPSCKLDRYKVREIRAAVGMTCPALAERYSVHPRTIYKIRAGKLWKGAE